MESVIFKMKDIQHKEWFIMELLSHIRLPFMQKIFATQSRALEIAMKLEDSPVGENAVVSDSDLDIAGELDAPVARYQERKRTL